jgi:N-acetylmuramic acid 6-phosphate etherase
MNIDTEKESLYNHLENQSTLELIKNINNEDRKVADVIKDKLDVIEKVIDVCVQRLSNGGRLFYIGAGTSGRLGILDASECPPTFGVSSDLVIGIIAGGDTAIRNAVEGAEDSLTQAWDDLKSYNVTKRDVVVGIAASGRTPYVIGGLEACNRMAIATACIVCSSGSKIAEVAQNAIELVVGPEFLTGSTRMKSGTAQKMVLNMITTASMIKLGKVKGNRMVDMQLSNEKLIIRGTNMIMDACSISAEEAKKHLLETGSVRAAIESIKKGS